MNIHLKSHRVPLGQHARGVILARIERAFDRFSDRLGRVTVHILDVNGPRRGGLDKECLIDVILDDGEQFFGRALGARVLDAVDGACQRARRGVNRHVEQAREREQGNAAWLRVDPAGLYGPLSPVSEEFGS